MLQRIMIFLSIFLIATGAHGQSTTATISGFVYDDSNGEALIGANVFIEDTQIGASTNQNGYYVIPKVPPGKYTFVVHYIGYKGDRREIQLAAGENKTITARLQAEDIQLQTVVVTGESIPEAEKMFEKPISKLELSAQQIRDVPQVAEADLLRTLQTLPGILPVSDFSSALYVRGGTPDQNLYLIDGTDVYNPEHAFGLFSTFNTDAIKKVELSKGGFSAQYGGRLSSILDVTNIDGNREEFEGSSSISLLSARTTLQMPIGRIGSISGSFRRTYFDKTIAKAIDDVPNYYFYDGNIKAFFEIDGKNKLTISGYGGEDVLDLVFNNDASDEAGFNYSWGNRTGSVRWTRIFTPRLFANFWVTGSRFDSDFDFGDTVDFIEENSVTDLTFKGNFEYHHSKALSTLFGFEHKNLHLIFRQEFPGGRIDVDMKPKHYIGFVHNSWRPNWRWDIEFGLRYNYFAGDDNFHKLAPRASVKYRLSDSVNFKAAGGKYFQFLHRIPREFIADIWVASNEFQKQSTAYHAIWGLQKDFANSLQVEVEGFYKDYNNLFSFNDNVLTDLQTDQFENGEPVYTKTGGVFDRGDGWSTGFEVLLRKNQGGFTGWLGYSLAFTRYQVDGVNENEFFAPRHDRVSTLNIVGTVDFKNLSRELGGEPPIQHKSNWKLGFTFVHASGQPITSPGSGYFAFGLPDRDVDEFEYFPPEINNLRLPPYIRLDISLTYERHFKNWSIIPYVQVFNVGNRKNVWFLNYDLDELDIDIDTLQMFPIIPTLGVNFKF